MSQFSEEPVIDLYDNNNQISSFTLFNISSLLCFENPLISEYNFMLEMKQIDLITEQINSNILEIIGLNKESILEIVIKQTELVMSCLEKIKNSSEKIKFKV